MKKVILMSLILLVGCSKPDLPMPEVLSIDNIFSVNESSVSNGQSLHFDLPSNGTFILILTDKETNQVISKEKFKGQIGENVKKIYTNSIQSKYLYLTLVDDGNNQIGKTTINLNK